MSLVDTDFPDDADVVVVEVVSHLLEVDGRSIVEPAGLAEAWAEVHRCDDAVLEALDPADRSIYQATIDTSRSRSRSSRRSRREPIVEERVVGLHLALHRRLVVLRDLVPSAD